MSNLELINKLHSLAIQCKQSFMNAGIDGRTNCFSRLFRDPSQTTKILQSGFQFSLEQSEQLLNGVLSERYADFNERRQTRSDTDIPRFNFFLSQGYKRGLRWQGVPLGKTCYDVAIYQQMIQEIKPKTLIELGTGLGGSTLFFLDNARMFGLDLQVITMDKNDKGVNRTVIDNEAIEFIAGNVKDIAQLLPAERLLELPRPWLIIEDSHQYIPVIVEHLHPLMEADDYLVIEDLISEEGFEEIRKALQHVPQGSLLVDTFYTDMFGMNVTCSPDAIFRKM